jgi:hypothetical protein
VRLQSRLLLVCVVTALSACKPKPQRFTATVEVLQVRSFGGGTGPKNTDLELKYSECPADARQNLRLGKEFATCGEKLKAGDKLQADVVLSWNAERGFFRNEVVKLAGCDVKLDPKDDANYQSVEACSEVKATGMSVGVRCNRGRTPELLAKCPWLRRD